MKRYMPIFICFFLLLIVIQGCTNPIEDGYDSSEGESDGVADLVGNGNLSDHDAQATFSTDTGEVRFSFSYSLYGTPKRGEQIQITVRVKNDGPDVYRQGDEPWAFFPNPTLFHMTADENRFVIPSETAVIPEGGMMLVAPGDSGGATFFYTIPADAPSGRFDLQLSYGGDSQVFEGVFTLED